MYQASVVVRANRRTKRPDVTDHEIQRCKLTCLKHVKIVWYLFISTSFLRNNYINNEYIQWSPKGMVHGLKTNTYGCELPANLNLKCFWTVLIVLCSTLISNQNCSHHITTIRISRNCLIDCHWCKNDLEVALRPSCHSFWP